MIVSLRPRFKLTRRAALRASRHASYHASLALPAVLAGLVELHDGLGRLGVEAVILRRELPQLSGGDAMILGAGAFDHVQEARAREARAFVARDRIDDLAIAALHQHVGDLLGDRLALRDRKQMRLALGAGIGH